jgi:hypothetical protein
VPIEIYRSLKPLQIFLSHPQLELYPGLTVVNVAAPGRSRHQAFDLPLAHSARLFDQGLAGLALHLIATGRQMRRQHNGAAESQLAAFEVIEQLGKIVHELGNPRPLVRLVFRKAEPLIGVDVERRVALIEMQLSHVDLRQMRHDLSIEPPVTRSEAIEFRQQLIITEHADVIKQCVHTNQ